MSGYLRNKSNKPVEGGGGGYHFVMGERDPLDSAGEVVVSDG